MDLNHFVSNTKKSLIGLIRWSVVIIELIIYASFFLLYIHFDLIVLSHMIGLKKWSVVIIKNIIQCRNMCYLNEIWALVRLFAYHELHA